MLVIHYTENIVEVVVAVMLYDRIKILTKLSQSSNNTWPGPSIVKVLIAFDWRGLAIATNIDSV